MKNFFPIIIFTFILLHPFFSTAQLSGTYTIGGTNPDFSTISQAANSLVDSGISGPVIFNIRTGIYIEQIQLSNVNGSSATNTITFQSETLDSSSVTVSYNTYLSVFESSGYSGEYVIFKEITITNNLGYAISFRNGKVENCVITSTNIVLSVNNGAGSIINSEIIGNIEIWNSTSPTLISGNNISGDINVDKTNCFNNIIYGNTFRISGGIIDNNIIHSQVVVSYNSITVIKNNKIYAGTLGSQMFISYSNNTKLIMNEIYVTAYFAYSNNCQLIGNKLFEDVSFSFSNGCLINNNFFYKSLDIGYSNSCKVYSNNFSSNVNNYIMIGSGGCDIKNNNMPYNIWGYVFSNTISNNNYYPIGGIFDASPINIDPEYVSASDLHARNLQLMEKGVYIPLVQYDIDSTQRLNPSTIGANEICISKDSIDILCGDSILLSLCTIPTSGNYLWTPSLGLSNSSILRPKASPLVNTLYTVSDTVSGYADSIFVNVNPYQVKTNNDTMIYCGDSIYLFANYNAGADYQWEPVTGLSNPNSVNTEAKPFQTTMYVVSATTSGCGTTFDTIWVGVDSMPRSNASYYSDTCLNAIFYNLSTCASSYYWDFGDTTFSTDENSSHSYSFSGSKIIMLIAYNSYGSDTIVFSIYLDDCNTGIDNLNKKNDVKYYPNPTSGIITIIYESDNLFNEIEIQILNIIGETIYTDKTKLHKDKFEKLIDLAEHPNGIYFLKIQNGKKIMVHKIVLSK